MSLLCHRARDCAHSTSATQQSVTSLLCHRARDCMISPFTALEGTCRLLHWSPHGLIRVLCDPLSLIYTLSISHIYRMAAKFLGPVLSRVITALLCQLSVPRKGFDRHHRTDDVGAYTSFHEILTDTRFGWYRICLHGCRRGSSVGLCVADPASNPPPQGCRGWTANLLDYRMLFYGWKDLPLDTRV